MLPLCEQCGRVVPPGPERYDENDMAQDWVVLNEARQRQGAAAVLSPDSAQARRGDQITVLTVFVPVTSLRDQIFLNTLAVTRAD